MADLRSALLAVAEEAEKMQTDFQAQIDGLNSHIDYVESENTKLKKKLNKAKNLFRDLANIFENDEFY